MSPIKRAWLFARDFIDEAGCAWGIARMRDCERDGGHRWNVAKASSVFWAMGYEKTCERCGCSEIVPPTSGTTVSNSYFTRC